MIGKKRGLGRGLSALFGDAKPEEKNVEKSLSNKVSISDLSRNPYQPRVNFSKEKLVSLTNDKAFNTVLEMSSDVKKNNKINAYDNFELGLKMYSLEKYNNYELHVFTNFAIDINISNNTSYRYVALRL